MAEVKSVKEKMTELLTKAKAVKSDPNINHTLSQSQITEVNENVVLMAPYQYETIKGDNRYERI